MTPRKIFIFGLCVIAFIFIVSEVTPDEIRMGELTFRSPDTRKWFTPDTVVYKDISAIIASVDTSGYQSEQIEQIEQIEVIENDSVANVNSEGKTENIQTTLTVSDDFYPFEYSSGHDTLLFPFFRALGQMHLRNKPLRILHYGDSQIEGDRITSTIRNHIQTNHGGRGIGFLPVVPIHDVAITFQQNVSPEWKRFSISDRGIDTLVQSRRFGISGNFVRYLAANEDDSIAHIGLLPYYGGYRSVRTFTHVRLFYGQSETPFTAVVNRVVSQDYTAQNPVSATWWRFETPQNSFDLQLISSNLPDLYGIALDGDNGVAVDNLPLRGSAGLNFSRMNSEQMRQMFYLMDVEILILQFGANAVTALADNYDNYARNFTQQLNFLKSLKPGIAIIVVGVNDMSQNTPDGYKSYPNIEKMRDAQKKAAFDAGCIFWDLYEAMGGENSMPSWALATPPLAQKDFVHFTVGGAKIVGELFSKAWAMEYQKFLISARLAEK